MPSLQARSAHAFGPAAAGTRNGLLKCPKHASRKTAPDLMITVGVPACRLGPLVHLSKGTAHQHNALRALELD